jgi:hypothetical protein
MREMVKFLTRKGVYNDVKIGYYILNYKKFGELEEQAVVSAHLSMRNMK